MLLFAAACSTIHGVRPLDPGEVALEGSLGGPITELYGAPVPLPISTVGVGVGLGHTTDLHAAVHTSALALFGLGGLDLGVSKGVWSRGRSRLGSDLTLTGIGGDVDPGGKDGGFALFVQPSATLARDWGKQARQTFYGGLFGFVQLVPDPAGHAGIHLGNRWGLGPTLGIATELKWVSPYASSAEVAPHYYSPGELGAIAFQLGLDIRLGGAP